MVEAASLESRLSFEPPAPPPVDQSDDQLDAEATQSFEPAPVSAPAPATDSVDLSDAARAIPPATETTTNIGPSEIDPVNDGAVQADEAVPAPSQNAEPLTTDDGVAAQSSLQTAANEPITPGADDPLESNQDSSLALEEAGNDTLNETEAGRTLGQVIDVFA